MRPLPGIGRLRPHRPRSLRGRLTLTNVLLLTIGLILAAAASLVSLYTVLIGGIDDSLSRQRAVLRQSVTGTDAAEQVCSRPGSSPHAARENATLHRLSQDRLIVLTPSGTLSPQCAAGSDLAARERRDIVAAVTRPGDLAGSGDGATVNVDGPAYRIGVARLADGSLLVAAMPLEDIKHTVFRFVGFEALSGTVLLALLTAGSMVSARRQLRPLEGMVHTASAIAEGDFAQRIDRTGDSAEVVKLRDALNSMLHQVESAFLIREQGTEQLKQFVADASHELRTPIATIRGYIQLIEREMLSKEEERRARGRISGEADRMAHVVEELLILARLDHSPAQRLAPVDLARLARDGAADLRAQQPDRPVTVETTGEVQVLGDEAQLRKVVGNLLSNVRTHTPAESPVALWTCADDGHAVLRIADAGPGMRQEDADRVFDRFFRADPGRARLAGGSGLGMSIVQAVVETHGGSVRLATAPGEGLTVEVQLPEGRRGET